MILNVFLDKEFVVVAVVVEVEKEDLASEKAGPRSHIYH
jgi:hypothetical protein